MTENPILSPSTMSPRHPLKIQSDHPGDFPIWHSGDVPKWHLGDVLIWRDVPGRVIRDVAWTFSGHALEDLQNTFLGRYVVICWMSLNFYLLFFRDLFDWPNLKKKQFELLCWSFFCESSKWLLSVNYFRKMTST